MRYCRCCNVSVTGEGKHCPLCHGLLTGVPEPESEVFPRLPPPRYSRQLLKKLINFTAILSLVACFTVNWMIPQSGWWSIFAAVGIISAWITTSVGISQRRNIIKNITWQLFLITALTILLDFLTGWHGWSLDYVLPCLCVCAMASMVSLSLAMHMPPNEYMVNLVLAAFYGIFPVIFLLMGLVNFVYPSIICAGCSVMIVASISIFEGKSMRRELRKKFHL